MLQQSKVVQVNMMAQCGFLEDGMQFSFTLNGQVARLNDQVFFTGRLVSAQQQVAPTIGEVVSYEARDGMVARWCTKNELENAPTLRFS